MKTPGGRSSRLSIKNPQSQFTTERNGAMKFEIFLGNAQFQIPGSTFWFFSVFPYFLQGTCSKRNCAVLHTTLQIKDESDFANDTTQIISRRESLL